SFGTPTSKLFATSRLWFRRLERRSSMEMDEPLPRAGAPAEAPAGFCVESFLSLSSSERMSTFERTRTCLTADSTTSGAGGGATVSPKLISGTGSGVLVASAAAGGGGGGTRAEGG